jgi:hypothetical protein
VKVDIVFLLLTSMLAIDLGGIDILKNKKKSNGDFNFEKGR